MIGQTSLGKNVYATAQSKVSEISYSIGKALNIERNIEPYVNMVGKTKEDKGIEVKLDEVMIDKDRLNFNLIFNTMEPVDWASFKNMDVFINGKKMNPMESGQNSAALDETNTVFSSLGYYKIEEIEQMEDIEIKLVLKDLEYYKGELEGVESGSWDFEFIANGKELALKTESLPIDYTFNIDNYIYKLDKLEYNPVRQTIKGKLEEIVGKYKPSPRIELRGYDNLDNRIIFFINSAGPEEVEFSYQRNYPFLEEWSDEITSITLAPFNMDSLDNKQVGEEFTIFLNK